jgi:ABC-type bacteriocin/lantibiotic exporter with double-glycine peptidase domain
MSIELPLYKQENDNTCALACLRMVLAAYSRHVEERELVAQARMERKGIRIDELERLARQFQLVAEIQQITLAELRSILAEGKLPIAYIDRVIFELSPRQRLRHSIRNAIIHNVILTEVSDRFVTFHDPRIPRITRKTTRLFGQAYSGLGGHCVVCSKPMKVQQEGGSS